MLDKQSLLYNIAKQIISNRPSKLGMDESKFTDAELWEMMAQVVSDTFAHCIEQRRKNGCDCPNCLIAELDECTDGDPKLLLELANDAAEVLKGMPPSEVALGNIEPYFRQNPNIMGITITLKETAV